jgi:ABC-type phosphate/phosphonate transport system substrate-binding protein
MASHAYAAGAIADAGASIAPTDVASSYAVYTFTSPPREQGGRGDDFYQPIVELLTKATGKKFVYKNPGNWLTYQLEMRKGTYDLVFDGPHFVGWRIRQAGHTPLLRLPQPHVWAVITKSDSKVGTLKELAGRKACVHAPPNFGTLTFLSLFENPARQPYMHEIKGWEEAYQGVVAGKCEAAILPLTNLNKLDPDRKATKIVHQHKPYPNQAFTAGPRIDPDLQAAIFTALTSDEGKIATQGLRDRFCKGQDLVPATKEEYGEVALVLKNYWGFEF